MEKIIFGDTENSLEAIVRLLLMTVYADAKQRQQEMIELHRQVAKLEIVLSGSTPVTPQSISTIAKHQSADVQAALDGPERSLAIEEAVHAITGSTRHQMMLQAMRSVANADWELNPKESQLLSRAAEIWGIEIP